MTLKKDSRPEDDANIQALCEAGTSVVTLVGKSWDLHVEEVIQTTKNENLRMIAESIAYFKGMGKEVIYDAEHFFDAYKDDADYAMATLRAAADGGGVFAVLNCPYYQGWSACYISGVGV